MPVSHAEVLVGRRYLERGFLDAALKLFARNVEHVPPSDWVALADRLLDRQRVIDAVHVCDLGQVPLPRERILALADAHMRRKDLDAAIHLYEVAGADRERWGRVVDVLTASPERERQALEVAQRFLGEDEPAGPKLVAVGR